MAAVRLSPLIGLISAPMLTGCQNGAGTAPVTISIARTDYGCSIQADGQAVSIETLATVLRDRSSRRAILRYDPDTPYRCIGGAIFQLQRNRYRVVFDPPLPTEAELNFAD